MNIIIDRFEENMAICELSDSSEIAFIKIKRDFLPGICKEGDVIVWSNCLWEIDYEKKRKLLETIEELENEFL